MGLNKWTDTRVPESKCHRCGSSLDAATGGGRPSPGDVSVCITCAEVHVFDENLLLRRPTAEEEQLFSSSRVIKAARDAVMKVMKQRTVN